MLHFTNSEMSRGAMALNVTPATSTSNTTSTASNGFPLTQFEDELSSLVNEALQAAGVSPSQASFSFNPTSSSSATTSTSNSTASSSASTGSTSQTNAATGNSQSNTSATSSATSATSTSDSSSSLPLSLTDSTDPVVGTEGLIYDPKVATFGGMGAAPITDTNMLTNPFTGEKYSADLVFDGYEKIYGSDTTSLEGALMQQWGPTAVEDFVSANPGTPVATVQQETAQTQSNFELYGPWASFTDPSTGVLSYFDANGVQYADGTGPANQMFTALGTPNTTGWDSATAL